ncbi:hypothetical protein L3X38_035099 [Prunus dulcis]|uniref:Uncharacterized protein n=1 Tax=Prunus dulcis TaxID=3755 RepID=A0AAD4VJ19_PRUDU|nr:hypothetical protein L3X38_035099 [Prunus dulcis]
MTQLQGLETHRRCHRKPPAMRPNPIESPSFPRPVPTSFTHPVPTSFTRRRPWSSGPTKSSTPGSSAIFEFKSSKEIQVEHDSRATATLGTDTDLSRDARALRERVLK